MERFPLIVGPTAGGKSALAMALVERVRAGGRDAEIIAADAFQVYRGMDIGTAKPSRAERDAVPHHLIDVVEPGEAFTVHDWLSRANAAVAEVRGRGRLPIVVGGTHLYAKAFLEGLFEGPAGDAVVREGLRGMEPSALRAELERVDPESAARLHPNDLRRTVRALEVHRLTGRPISAWQQQWDREDHRRRDCLLVGLLWPPERINPRINARVRAMVQAGLVEEVRGLWKAGKMVGQAAEAIGYKQLLPHVAGRGTLEDAVERIKIETRQFAKSQRTWLKRLRVGGEALWIEASTHEPETCADRVLDALAGGVTERRPDAPPHRTTG